MRINWGYIWAKVLKYSNRPALRGCCVDKTARIGSGSNCIDMTIGRYSYIGMNNSLNAVDIGAFCSIASYCLIGGGAHSMDTVSTSPVFHTGRNILGKNFSSTARPDFKRVRIGNDVWIGQAAFIKEGIVIGDGAIIGAHAVVTHDVPPYAVVAGVPAKIIRYRFDDNQIKALLASKWWDMADDELAKNADCFISIDQFLNRMEVMKHEDCSCR